MVKPPIVILTVEHLREKLIDLERILADYYLTSIDSILRLVFHSFEVSLVCQTRGSLPPMYGDERVEYMLETVTDDIATIIGEISKGDDHEETMMIYGILYNIVEYMVFNSHNLPFFNRDGSFQYSFHALRGTSVIFTKREDR